MQLTLACVGNLRLPGAAAMQDEYRTRLGRYAGVQVLEVGASRRPERDRRLEEEGRALRKLVPRGALTVALDRQGEAMDSEALARRLEGWAGAGRSRVVFLVGGSDGLPGDLVAEADLALSFSRLTFPHQLFRILLLEQLYRAFTIQRQEPYHK